MSSHPFGPKAARHEAHKKATEALIDQMRGELIHCSRIETCSASLHWPDCPVHPEVGSSS